MAQHSSKTARFQAATANRLNDGEVVYLTTNDVWSADFAAADIADGDDAAQTLLVRALLEGAEGFEVQVEVQVLDPYLFAVLPAPAGGYLPASVREVIRARGPTVRLDLGKQAG